MSLKTTSQKPKGCILFTSAILIACGMFLAGCGGTRYASISGQIIDDTTGQPVAKAKIIVTLWSKGMLNSVPFHSGAISDENGQFSVDLTAPFSIREINIEAASPANKYGVLAIKGDGNYVVRVKDLADWQKESRGIYLYESFSGMWSKGRDVVFPKEP